MPCINQGINLSKIDTKNEDLRSSWRRKARSSLYDDGGTNETTRMVRNGATFFQVGEDGQKPQGTVMNSEDR